MFLGGRISFLVEILPVRDPGEFLGVLRATVLPRPDERFQAAMRQLIVDELYEDIRKLRNARESNHANSVIPF